MAKLLWYVHYRDIRVNKYRDSDITTIAQA